MKHANQGRSIKPKASWWSAGKFEMSIVGCIFMIWLFSKVALFLYNIAR